MGQARKREVIELVHEIVARGAPAAANKLLKVTKTFFGWCVGRAILEVSPANGLSAPTREKSRDRVLSDAELTSVLAAARQIHGPYGAIVEFLALSGQRREEVAQLTWTELDLASRVWTIPACRTKNATFGGARRPILYRLGRVVAGEVISARHCRNIEPTLAQWPFQRLQTRYQQETLSVPCAYSYVR